MTHLKKACLPLLLLILAIGCKKSGTSPIGGGTGTGPGTGGGIDTSTIAITAIGTPVGTPVSKSIGAAGGTITSPDGRVKVTIPPGALSANTNISIQPVTDECPGGIGLAYDLLPNGTKFAVPATLTFNYADSDINGTDPYLLYIGFQDSAREWQIDLNDKDVDTVAKTVSLDISHFSIWAMDPYISIISSRSQLKAGEQAGIGIFQVSSKLGSSPNGIVTNIKPLPASQLGNWLVNGAPGGNSQDGTITGTGATVTYTAPGTIDKDRYVYISVTNTSTTVVKLKGGKAITFTNKKYNKFLKLLSGNYIYDIGVVYTMAQTNTIFADNYKDSVTFEVDVTNFKVTAVTFHNELPTVNKPFGLNGQASATWVPGTDPGLINVATATGLVIPEPTTGDTIVVVTVTSIGTTQPKWNIHPLDGSPDYIEGGNADPSPLQGIVFNLTDQPQTVPIGSAGAISSLTAYVKPRKQ